MPTPFYDYADIIEWAKISQALALVGEKKKRATTGSTVDEDLHIKIYDTRKAVEHLYNEDNDNDDLYEMANYLYALCGIYVLEAQGISGDGGQVSGTVGGQLLQNPLYITGANFSTATAWAGGNSLGMTIRASYTLRPFYQPASRFIIEGEDWDRTPTGFQLRTGVGEPFFGFDASAGNISDGLMVFITT
jgi:hypothetical protein